MTELLNQISYRCKILEDVGLAFLPPIFMLSVIILFLNGSEKAFRLGGGVLQLAGVFVVSIFLGMIEIRNEFGQIGVRDLLCQKMKSFLKGPQEVILAPAAGRAMSTSGGRAILTISDGLPTSVEEQLSLLRSRLDEAEKKINKIPRRNRENQE